MRRRIVFVMLVVLTLRPPARVAFYLSLVIGMMLFGVRESTEFIYFQF